MLPPAPGLFSTMNCCESCSASDCAIRRARMSIAWPAAKPTTMRTGCAGYVCAAATLETAGDARALAASCWNCLRRSFTGFLPHRQLLALQFPLMHEGPNDSTEVEHTR